MKKETHTAIKQQLIIAGKVLVAEGQDDFTRGHISVRVPGNPKLFFMKAHSLGLDEITMKNILTIDLEGNVVSGSARRHSEVYIHSEIFKARADVNCVIHTHPTYSVAFSGTGHPMKAYSQPGAMFSGEVGVYTDTITLIRSHALGCRRRQGARQRPRGPAQEPWAGGDRENHRGGRGVIDHAGKRRANSAHGRSRRQPAPEFPPDDIAKFKHEIGQPEQFKINFDYLARRVKRRKA